MIDQTYVSPLIFGAIVAIVVALYGYFIPPLFGRSRLSLPVLDIVMIAILIAVTAFIMTKIGLLTLVVGK